MPPGGPGGTIARFFSEQDLPAPRVAATCVPFTQLAALIRGTDWRAVLPSVVVERELLGVEATSIKLKERARRFGNCIVYRSEPPLTPAAAAFASMSQSYARIVTPATLTKMPK